MRILLEPENSIGHTLVQKHPKASKKTFKASKTVKKRPKPSSSIQMRKKRSKQISQKKISQKTFFVGNGSK